MSFLFKPQVKSRFIPRAVLIALTLLPLVILIYAVFHFAVDVPYWDQWNFVPLLGKSLEWGVSFEDLWGLHNEHRLFFPRLLMLGLAHLSAYNINCELAFILLLALGIFCLVLIQLRQTLKRLAVTGPVWVVPVLSLLAFSLNQGENWVWGWQIQIFLNVLAVIAGIMLLVHPRLNWLKLILALFCGVVATYSFANGLTYWFIGLLGLGLVSSVGPKKKKAMISFWLLTTGLVLLSYLVKFRPGLSSGKPVLYFLSHPSEYLSYIFKYLGAAVINYQEYALMFGMIGAVFFFWSFRSMTFKKKRAWFSALLPFFLLGLYALASASMTGVGRVGLGSEQAMSYRYVTFSSLLWFSNSVFLYILIKLFLADVDKWKKKRFVFVIFSIFSLSMLFLLGRTSYRVGYRALQSYHDSLVPARRELRRGEDEELLNRLYIDPDSVREGIEILKRHKLSVFRED
jgi:hypothetical protein